MNKLTPSVKLADGASNHINSATLFSAVGHILAELLSYDDATATVDKLCAFNSNPTLTIKQYLQRLAKYAKCSDQCFILALIYMDRVARGRGKLTLNRGTVHK